MCVSVCVRLCVLVRVCVCNRRRVPSEAHLPHTLHGAADLPRHALEAVQVPSGDLGDDVVQAGLEAGCGLLRHGVLDVGQRDAQGKFGGHKRQRVSKGKGGRESKRRGRTKSSQCHKTS